MRRKRSSDDLVTTIDQIVENVFILGQMSKGNLDQRNFHHKRIKNGKLFVAVSSENGWHFAPSKFCGYVENGLHHSNLLNERDGRKTNVVVSKILGQPLDYGNDNYGMVDAAFLKYCAVYGIAPSKHHRVRRYWVKGNNNIYPDEVTETDQFIEGASKSVNVNRFERDPAARAACIAHFGHTCQICGVDFFETYGEVGRNFRQLSPLHT